LSAPVPRRPLVVAHRGDSRNHPENTLAAVAGAMALGADVIELDVHCSADDVAMVLHDRDLLRTTGQAGSVDAMSAAEISRRHAGIPRLAEVVAMTDEAAVPLCLEFKDGAYRAPGDAARWLVDQVTRFALHRRAIVNLASAEIAARVRRLDPAIRVALDCEQRATGDAALRLAAGLAAAGAGLVELEQHAVTADMVRACHQLGLEVWAWTANDPADWDRLCAADVDAILADDPAGLIAYLAARAAP